jgi:ketosteroid isomerase-like protein
MTHRTRTIVAALLASGAVVSTNALPGSTSTADPAAAAAASAQPADGRHGRRAFDRFLERYEAANSAFLNGDPTLWQSLTSQKEPVSIFGGFGGLGESGVAEVNQRYALAATAFQPSGAVADFEYLVKDVQGRLAYTVAIERADVLYTGQTELHRQELRVTMMFRFERGEWKIIHRHADMMVDLELPS